MFTFDGIAQNFIATSARTGAGTLSFSPALPSSVADDTGMTVNAGFVAALAVGAPADVLSLTTITAHTRGASIATGQYTSGIDTTGSTIDAPVYLVSGTGALSLTAPAVDKILQIVGYVATLANPGIINGRLQGATVGDYGARTVQAGKFIANTTTGAEFLSVFNATTGHQIISGQADTFGNGALVIEDHTGAGQVILQASLGGQIGIGAVANTSTALDVVSTTLAARLPCMTTTQKNAIASPLAGFEMYDTTLNAKCVYTGAAWQTIAIVGAPLPRAAVSSISPQTIPNTTDTLLSFDTLETDNASFAGSLPVTHITAPSTGWYLIKADIQWNALSAAGSQIIMDLFINSAVILDGHLVTLSGSASQTMSISVMRQLTAADTISVNVNQALGAGQTVSVARLCITRLSD